MSELALSRMANSLVFCRVACGDVEDVWLCASSLLLIRYI